MLFHANFLLLILVQSINPSFAVVTHARALLFTAVDKPEDGLQQHVGTIDFFQDPNGHVVVNGSVADLDAGDHGFHVHVFGAYGQKCAEAGAHFNPENKVHGGPNDTERHVGDLGNIHADANGNARIDIQDSVIALNGRNSAVGRSVVVHFKPDDLGKGSGNDSKKTGNAGPRFACGIIGRSCRIVCELPIQHLPEVCDEMDVPRPRYAHYQNPVDRRFEAEVVVMQKRFISTISQPNEKMAEQVGCLVALIGLHQDNRVISNVKE